MTVYSSLAVAPGGLVRLRIQLVYPEVVAVQAGLFVAMLWRGFDYVSPPDEEVKTLTAVEQALPFSAWGGLFLVAALAGLLGLRWVRWPLTALAHYLAVALYFSFGLGSLVSIMDRIKQPPSWLAVAWIVTIMGASLITVAVVRRWAARYLTLAWTGVGLGAVGSVVILASSAGVYGWRTATGWLFVQCIAHLMCARASSDTWREHRDQLKKSREAAGDEHP